jgi:hypothetical protein
MTQRVLKYSIAVDDEEHTFDMPEGAKLLHVACQEGAGNVQLWAQVEPEILHESRTFRVFATGQPLTDTSFHEWHHVGTTLALSGALVWHLYERVYAYERY